MAEPLLNLRNVRLVLQGVGGGCGSEGMGAEAFHVDPARDAVAFDDVPVDARLMQVLLQFSCGVVPDGLKERVPGAVAVAGVIEVIVDELARGRVKVNEANLSRLPWIRR